MTESEKSALREVIREIRWSDDFSGRPVTFCDAFWCRVFESYYRETPRDTDSRWDTLLAEGFEILRKT